MHKGMSLIVKSTIRWTFGFALIFGLSTVLYGHLTPGGGFAGGVMMACAFIMWILAYGGRGNLSGWLGAARKIYVLGPLLFLSLALTGYYGGAFFNNFIRKTYRHLESDFALVSASMIPPMDIAVGLTVAGSLLTVFLLLSSLRMPSHGTDEDVFPSMEEAE